MNRHRWPRWLAASTATLGCVAVLSVTPAAAGDDTIKHVDQHFSGDRVIGTDTLHFIGMNPLAETVKIDVVATVVTPAPFPTNANPAPAGAAVPAPAPTTKPTPKGLSLNAEQQKQLVLHCDVDSEVVQLVSFYESCAGAAADSAASVVAPANTSLAGAEQAVSAFRKRSDDEVASSPSIHDEAALDRYRRDVAGVLNGTGGTGKDAVDAAVRAVGTWPQFDADKARLAVARYLSLIDKVKDTAQKPADYDPARKAAFKSHLESAMALVSDDAKTKYNDRRTAVITTRDRIEALTPGSYVVDVSTSCTALFGKGLERKITVTLTPNGANAPSITDDVTAVCPTRSFVSTGFTFVSGGDRTFGTVAPNTAAAPPPAGATPPNTIVETNRSDVHAASISFVNFHVAGSRKSEDGVFASFGVIVGTGSNSTADFAAGLSYAFARSFVVSAGGFLGSETHLAPGYTVGGPIAANVSNPPTVTTRKVKPFLGISFNL